MSFILDALKKSEAERLRKNTPGIASIPESSSRKKSTKWIWLALGLVAINLMVLAGLLFKVDRLPGQAEAPITGVIEEVRDQPEVSVSDAAPDVERNQSAATDVPSVTGIEEQQPDPAASELAVSAPQTGTVNDGLKTFNDLRATGILQLPDMHLDIHVYSGQPADRFVFVNMSKYKENSTLTEGPVVSEITQNGVVLQYQGTTFLLPRE